jgi:SAM-dependent methyltransferase
MSEVEPAVPSSSAAAGAAVYSKALLSIYDLEVLGIELRFVFGCPASRMLALYDRHVSARHLDVGVGTGYFLDKCRFPVERPVLHLLDLNRNSLDATARRVARYAPVAHHRNVLEPLDEPLPEFDSIGACNFLHCLPGPLAAKEEVFTNLMPRLNKGGVFFGTTVLGKGVDATGALYRLANAAYNRKRIFSNLDDDAEGLERLLARNFGRHTLEVVGSVALFAGWK